MPTRTLTDLCDRSGHDVQLPQLSKRAGIGGNIPVLKLEFRVSKETLSSIDKTFSQAVKRRLPHSVAASNPSAFQISSRYKERLHAFIGRHLSATEGTLLASCLGRFGL
jgi:hypothetical protein